MNFPHSHLQLWKGRQSLFGIMSDQDAVTPRVFLMRHGETEWAKSGRFTGTTDIELTEDGIKQVSSAGVRFVGVNNLINPRRLGKVFVSPRKRAVQTLELLLPQEGVVQGQYEVTATEEIAEWNYGRYEGLKEEEIRSSRKERGLDLDREWNIWRDGCEGGESKDAITERLDKLISRIKDFQRPHMGGEKPVDVLIVAHGLILRCFCLRWIGFDIDYDVSIMFSPGAVATLSYKNGDADRPALHIGPPSK
ncbi:hypothetical protein M9X92_011545 [Pyricularia oryzae]|nr:hypothetical protein M9X92_011545 [Pyricularia oryzae]